MTQCLSAAPTPGSNPTPGQSRIYFALALASCVALSACSVTTTPLSSAAKETPAAPAVTPPLAAPSSEETQPAALALAPVVLSAAVAQLFPAPSAHYSTPGLSQTPSSFTTNPALGEWLGTLSLPSSEGDISPKITTRNIGTSQQGTPIGSLILAMAADHTPGALAQNRNPTVLIVAGQSGTASASTEAVLAFAHQLTTDSQLHPLLQKVNLLLVPRANPDGFDNQQLGTANGTYLYRDHLTLKTPEARALAELVQDYQPSVVVELGEFDAIEPTLLRYSAVRANDVGLQYSVTPNGHEFLNKSVRTWLHQPLSSQLAAAGLRVDWRFNATGRNASDGFAMETIAPTTLTNVSTLKNALGLAIDSRGSDLGQQHIQRRIHSLVLSMQSILSSTAQRAADIQKVQTFVARDVASQACRKSMVVHAQPLVEDKDITLIDAATAQLRTQRLRWTSSLEMRDEQHRQRPCGYWLSANATPAAERLSALGVQVQRIAELSQLRTEADTSASSSKTIDAPPGSYYVSMNQPLANLAIAALEAGPAYSYVNTGVVHNPSDVLRIVAPANLVFEDE